LTLAGWDGTVIVLAVCVRFQGIRELELRKALERVQPTVLAAMAKVQVLMQSGEAEAAATGAREEAVDAMEGYGLDGDDLGGGALLSGPYRGASMRQLIDSVVAMTTAAETEDVPGPPSGWKDWRERFVAVAESGEPDADWEAEDAASGEVPPPPASAEGTEGEQQPGPQTDLRRVYLQISRRLLQMQRWFFAHSGQEGHPRFTENMPTPGGVSAAAAKAAAAAAGGAAGALEGGATGGGEGQPGALEEGGGGDGGSSDTEGEDDGDETRGLSEAPQDGEEEGEDDRRRKDRVRYEFGLASAAVFVPGGGSPLGKGLGEGRPRAGTAAGHTVPEISTYTFCGKPYSIGLITI
jgi:hypothetical protein